MTPQIFKQYPSHVAIVPDGNGRWAQKRGLPRSLGHRSGIINMLKLTEYISEYPIKYVTFYGFSTENWARPELEISGLFEIVKKFVEEHLEDINRCNIKVNHIGRAKGLPVFMQQTIEKAVDYTKNNTGMNLNVAWNYGGRAEIIDAVTSLIQKGCDPGALNEKTFSDHLYTAGMPDVDLLIRTGAVTRLSNFLIWQTAYAEYYFSDVLWPDFGKKDIDKALEAYSQRDRRFGGLKDNA